MAALILSCSGANSLSTMMMPSLATATVIFPPWPSSICMLSPRSVILISTFEKSGADGGDAAGCASNGPESAITAAVMIIFNLRIGVPHSNSGTSYHRIAWLRTQDRQLAAMDGSFRPPYAPKFGEALNPTATATRGHMTSPIAGGVDCDLHPAVPHLTSLLPYLNEYWRDQVTTRGMTDLVSQSYPTNSPISSRPDWRPAQGKPGSSLADMQ